MSNDPFIEKFAFAIEVDAASLSFDTEFKSLPAWDSLNTLSVIAMADADYGVALSGKDIEDAMTVGDLEKLVKTKLSGQ